MHLNSKLNQYNIEQIINLISSLMPCIKKSYKHNLKLNKLLHICHSISIKFLETI